LITLDDVIDKAADLPLLSFLHRLMMAAKRGQLMAVLWKTWLLCVVFMQPGTHQINNKNYP